jgi:enoyl-CoA hydratase/carnithine racemase
MAYEEILMDVADGIATITMNRPEKLNAWTGTMAGEIRDAMTDAGQRADVRVIILTGAGRGFCAGADMDNLAGISDSGSNNSNQPMRPVEIEDGLNLPMDFRQQVSYFPQVPKPVIAAINGPAAGLGLVMSLYADMRFASDNAKFMTAFAKRGLIAEHGISWMLPELVGVSNALDLLLSSRLIDAGEALHMGLVNKVFPAESFLDDVKAYASEIARFVSPRSTKVMKRQVYNAMFQNLAEAIGTGNEEMVRSFTTEDFKEGVAHFVEKRHPKFTGH